MYDCSHVSAECTGNMPKLVEVMSFFPHIYFFNCFNLICTQKESESEELRKGNREANLTKSMGTCHDSQTDSHQLLSF